MIGVESVGAANREDRRQAQAFFERCAARGAMATWLPSEEATLVMLVPVWDLRPDQRVLEAGCGTGRLTGTLARLVGRHGEVVACDESPEMLRRLRARRLPKCVHPLCVSAAATGMGDARFDRIICLNVFPHFHDPRAVLAEFRRTIRGDGMLCIAHCWRRTIVNRYHQACHPAVAHHQLPPRQEMRRLLQSEGFAVRGFVDDWRGYCLSAVPDSGRRLSSGRR
jgi:ubiquinone/menaquinone biosynthesis C-methylase UbiE